MVRFSSPEAQSFGDKKKSPPIVFLVKWALAAFMQCPGAPRPRKDRCFLRPLLSGCRTPSQDGSGRGVSGLQPLSASELGVRLYCNRAFIHAPDSSPHPGHPTRLQPFAPECPSEIGHSSREVAAACGRPGRPSLLVGGHCAPLAYWPVSEPGT